MNEEEVGAEAATWGKYHCLIPLLKYEQPLHSSQLPYLGGVHFIKNQRLREATLFPKGHKAGSGRL